MHRLETKINCPKNISSSKKLVFSPYSNVAGGSKSLRLKCLLNMTEAPSDTANHQRLDEMLLHLTPIGAVIPYSICFDSEGSLWVASKGGIFKINKDTKAVLWEKRNEFPKKMMAFCQIHAFQDKVIHIQTGEGDLTEFRILNLDGSVETESFIDGKVQSFVINTKGDMFLTKQPVAGDEFLIYKTTFDCPIGWNDFCSAYDYCFQALCLLDDDTLVAATTTVPINICSKQTLKIIDANSGKILQSFSEAGKSDGQIFFPRSIQSYNNEVLVMDKTGRFQRFNKEGKFLGIGAEIDSYLGNGFIVQGDEAIVVCSGIVLAPDGETVCDDWLEAVKLDGSKWKTTGKPQ
ncbi:unnamed protein product [Bursaphelenchus xylophilus]|uniref:(pine wood nematode) hypothetical protein n=1 Tax=Bursaphelenchus xylophilus TaxID=6326 RepID=A0A1I7S5U1_BURXY|nr:unnamed protein product [Bursaphelenchus xylophilus]CAG9125063.1 unnamed protein product [Bursaphelenchus xylophilus]